MLVLFIASWSAIVFVASCHNAALIKRVQERISLASIKEDILSDELLQRSFPFLKSSCVRDALEQFLPICLNQGVESIDTSFRVETAVKLSICEFQASGLGHIPEACNESNIDSLMDCMIQLESSTQWWTTYSGNYQRLSSICFENSLPFEKDQILSLFLNITNLQTEINENLSNYFYNMMSDVESSAGNHLETITELFNEYMNQFREVFKTKGNEFKDDFKEFQEDMQSLLIQNTNLLKEKNVGFMQSMDSLQSMVDGIIIELKENDISSQIVQVRNENVHNVEHMGVLIQEMVQFQMQNQNQMTHELKRFFDDALQNVAFVSHEVQQSQIRAMEVVKVFDELKNSLIPTIMDELSPQVSVLKDDLLKDWKSLTEVVNGDFQQWNNQINGTFQEISYRLNSTMETINDIDRRLSNFKKFLTSFSRIVGYLIIFGHNTFIAVCYLLTNKYVWAALAIFLFVKKLSLWLPCRKMLYLSVTYAQIMAKCGIIVIAIYGGSRFGKIIMLE